MTSTGKPRVLILWNTLSGYSAASFRALVNSGAEVRVICPQGTPEAPFDPQEIGRDLDVEYWTGERAQFTSIARALEAFRPEILLVCSWNIGAYRRAARSWKGRGLRVLFMDNPWQGTPKQWLGVVGRQVVVQPNFDGVNLPGERQAQFARRLGFKQRSIISGGYSAADDFFTGGRASLPSSFLFVGRLAPEKGVTSLRDAYVRYREAASEPWTLRIAGVGPLADDLSKTVGVELLGFVSPSRLPSVMAASGCLVLPSIYEPWGVVIHEAVASGLAVICSDVCGASTRYVVDGFNGRVVPPADPLTLSTAMSWVSSRTTAQLADLSRASASLAPQLTPARWAEHFLERARELTLSR